MPVGIFSAKGGLDRAFTAGKRQEAKNEKSSFLNDVLKTIALSGVVQPVSGAVASEVGAFINKGASEKHNNWLLSEEASQIGRDFKGNREFKNWYDSDEQKRIASKLDVRSWERKKEAALLVQAYKERMQRPFEGIQGPTKSGAALSSMPYMPPDAYEDSTIEKFIAKDIDIATDAAVIKRGKIADSLKNLKTEAQVNNYLRLKNPYSKTYLGSALGSLKNLFGNKSNKDISDASIKEIKNDDFYKNSKLLKEAIKAYEDGADFSSIKDIVNKVVRNPEDLKLVAFKYKTDVATETTNRIANKTIISEVSQTTTNKLTGETNRIILKEDVQAIPSTQQELVDKTENLVTQINRLKFNEITKKNLLEELGNIQAFKIGDDKAEAVNFNPLNHKEYTMDSYVDALKIIKEYTKDRRNYEEYDAARAKAGERVMDSLIRNGVGGQTILDDLKAPAPPKFLAGSTKESPAYGQWKDSYNRASKKYLALVNFEKENQFTSYAISEGIGYFSSENSINAIAVPGKEKEFEELRTEFMLGVTPEQLKDILKKNTTNIPFNKGGPRPSKSSNRPYFADPDPDAILYEDLSDGEKYKVKRGQNKIFDTSASERNYLKTGRPLQYSLLSKP